MHFAFPHITPSSQGTEPPSSLSSSHMVENMSGAVQIGSVGLFFVLSDRSPGQAKLRLFHNFAVSSAIFARPFSKPFTSLLFLVYNLDF